MHGFIRPKASPRTPAQEDRARHGRSWRGRVPWCIWLRLAAASASLVPVVRVAAQDAADSVGAPVAAPSLGVEAEWEPTQWLPSHARPALRLSRPLVSPHERLGLVLRGVDLSDLLEVRGPRAVLRTDLSRLPAGEHELLVFVVTRERAWEEVARLPLRVQFRAGLERVALRPGVELTSTGQLDRRDPPDVEPTDRSAYQDLTLRLAVEGETARDGWTVALQGNAVGVSRAEQRLRFAELEGRAPLLDLADYSVQLRRDRLAFTIGHQSAGTHRFLPNNFGSRGVGGRAQLGSALTFGGALLHGTQLAGWSNPFGLSTPAHRLATADMGVEFVPSRPGALALSLSAVDGSLLPLTNFTQAAATDAETSRGGGLHVAASDLTQRIRVQLGYARSRFRNPGDPLLAGDDHVVAVETDTRSARYGELAMDLVPQTVVVGQPVLLQVVGRHERVDPLYRSVGAFVAADRDVNGADLTSTLGPLSLRAGAVTSRDNLQRLPSVLTTRTNETSVGVATPLGGLLPRAPALLPTVSYAWQRTHQRSDELPEDGAFELSHLPDQVSRNETVEAQWHVGSSLLSYRWNASHQDNRQPGRQAADFLTVVNLLSLGGTLRTGFEASVDLSRERQTLYEQSLTQQLDRIGASARWQPLARTDLLAVLSHALGDQPTIESRTRNTELQLELSRGFDLYRRFDGGTQGRVFIRYARTRAVVHPFTGAAQPLLDARITWTLNAGGSIRFY